MLFISSVPASADDDQQRVNAQRGGAVRHPERTSDTAGFEPPVASYHGASLWKSSIIAAAGFEQVRTSRCNH
jgi:hypothetical protein